jgi:hypothetical protein
MEFALDKELGDGVELEHEPAQQHARRTGGEVLCAFLTHANAIRLREWQSVCLVGKCKHSTSCRPPGKVLRKTISQLWSLYRLFASRAHRRGGQGMLAAEEPAKGA